MPFPIRALAAAALLVPVSTVAGEILALKDALGRVTYSDRRLPQTVVVGRLPLAAASSQAGEWRSLELRAQAAEVRERGRERAAALDQAWRGIRSAEADLEIAARQLEQGREPRPGERLGNVGPTSRLSPAYFARIAALEAEVVEARWRVGRAWSSLHAVRE